MKKPLFLTYVGVCLGVFLSTTTLFGQGGPLEPSDLLKNLTDNWTSYSGDYTGRRYSFLKQVTAENVKGLSMEWFNTSMTSACGPDGTQTHEAPVVRVPRLHRSSWAASATVSRDPTPARLRVSRAGLWW